MAVGFGTAVIDFTLSDPGPASEDVDLRSAWGASFVLRKEKRVRVGDFHLGYLPWHLCCSRADGETALWIAVQTLGLRAADGPDAVVRHTASQERLTEQCHEVKLQGTRAPRAWVTRSDCIVGSAPAPDDRPPAIGGDPGEMRLEAKS